MFKIVRGLGPFYEMGEPVKIDNTVYVPSGEEETGEFISAEEVKRRAEAEKAAEEKRFNDAVNAEVTNIISKRADAIEAERIKIIERAQKTAADIAAEAKASTLAIMEKAERECLLIKEQARKEGFDEGFGEGREESLEKYKKYIDAAGKLLAEINSRKDTYFISNEDELRKTAFEATKKIIMTELRSDPEVIDGIISEAAKNFRNSDYIKITLAEDGITERFRTDEKLMNEIIPFIPEIEIEFDKEAEEGTVILDNGESIVDAGIPTQLEFLQEIMKSTRERDDLDIRNDVSEKDDELGKDNMGLSGYAGKNDDAGKVDDIGKGDDAGRIDSIGKGDDVSEKIEENDEPVVKQTKAKKTTRSKKNTADESE